jgi:CheY-like chemotaxis protein
LERDAPSILLIEDDEFDRMTLTRMLEESGCSVMTTRRGAAAVDTFALYHRRLALVLASTGLSDVERIRLAEALYRIDPYVPVVMAARRPSHRPNSGDSGRSQLFAALIAEVQRRLHESSARAEAQAQSFARVQPPPPTSASARPHAGEADDFDEDVDRAEPESPISDDVFFPDLPPVPWTGSSRLTPIANLDPRNYIRRLNNARRVRRRRLRRIGFAIAAGCAAPLIVPPLLQIRTTSARASVEDAPVTLPPLASASISARVGIVPLVSSAHVKRSRLADDLSAASRAAPSDATNAKNAKTPAQPQQTRQSRNRTPRSDQR